MNGTFEETIRDALRACLPGQAEQRRRIFRSKIRELDACLAEIEQVNQRNADASPQQQERLQGAVYDHLCQQARYVGTPVRPILWRDPVEAIEAVFVMQERVMNEYRRACRDADDYAEDV